MEDLKVIIDILKDTPEKIIWLVAFYFVYKLFIVGSVFGIARLGIIKFTSIFKSDPAEELALVEANIVRDRQTGTLNSITSVLINEVCVEELSILVKTLRKGGNYVHASDVREAINKLKKGTK